MLLLLLLCLADGFVIVFRWNFANFCSDQTFTKVQPTLVSNNQAMSGVNHNMNHIVKRIETRVLAPPGGFSSVSFGSESAACYSDHSTYRKNKSIQGMKEDARRPEQHQFATRNKENDARYGRFQERRDSLDDMMDERRGNSGGNGIPGLETHYQKMQQSSSRCRPSNDAGSDPFTRQQSGSGASRADKNSYAEMLRQQISLKQSMTDEEREGRRPERYASEKTDGYHARKEATGDTYVASGRRRTGNHVGQSSITFC